MAPTYGVLVRTAELRKQMHCRGLTAAALAKLAKVSPPTVSKALAGRRIHPVKLRAIVAALSGVQPLPDMEALVEA